MADGTQSFTPPETPAEPLEVLPDGRVVDEFEIGRNGKFILDIDGEEVDLSSEMIRDLNVYHTDVLEFREDPDHSKRRRKISDVPFSRLRLLARGMSTRIADGGRLLAKAIFTDDPGKGPTALQKWSVARNDYGSRSMEIDYRVHPQSDGEKVWVLSGWVTTNDPVVTGLFGQSFSVIQKEFSMPAQTVLTELMEAAGVTLESVGVEDAAAITDEQYAAMTAAIINGLKGVETAENPDMDKLNEELETANASVAELSQKLETSRLELSQKGTAVGDTEKKNLELAGTVQNQTAQIEALELAQGKRNDATRKTYRDMALAQGRIEPGDLEELSAGKKNAKAKLFNTELELAVNGGLAYSELEAEIDGLLPVTITGNPKTPALTKDNTGGADDSLKLELAQAWRATGVNANAKYMTARSFVEGEGLQAKYGHLFTGKGA